MDYNQQNIYYPIFRCGDTVKLVNEDIDYNNPYSNLFTEKTFVIKNKPVWNYEFGDWQYDFQTNTNKKFLLQKYLVGVCRPKDIYNQSKE